MAKNVLKKSVKDIKKITLIGGGNMGSGIAVAFASAGYRVDIFSRTAKTLKKANKTIKNNLIFLAKHNLGKAKDVEKNLAQINYVQDIKEAVKNTDFVVECVAEDMELKQNIFKQLDEICPLDVILATNTSVMSPTEIASKSKHRERILATHWWYPAFLIPLVEVVQTKETAPWAIKTTIELHEKIGKRPVHVKKDVPGFIANRLQHALKREAISLVEHGIADAKTVDDSIKYSFGMRLPVLSTLENSDMNGLDLTLAIHKYLFKYLEDSHEPSSLLKEKVAKKELGFKTGTGFMKWTLKKQKILHSALLEDLAEKVLKMKKKP